MNIVGFRYADTVDISDPIYRELKSQAALEGRSLKELILLKVTRPPSNAA